MATRSTARGPLHLRRSVLLGSALGAWLGLLTGSILSLFVVGAPWHTTVVGGLLTGAAAGAVAGLGNHWAAGVTAVQRPPARRDGPAELERVSLPGVGSSYSFATAAGQRVGVVTHAGGRRDVVLYDHEDLGRAGRTVTLDPAEARTVAELLGLPAVVGG